MVVFTWVKKIMNKKIVRDYVDSPIGDVQKTHAEITKAKEEMFERTSTDVAPWYIVEGNDKRRERLNCISHILSKIPYVEIPHQKISLPERQFNPDYERRTLPDTLYVPKIF